MNLIIKNLTPDDIEIDDVGITIDGDGYYDLSKKATFEITSSENLIDSIGNDEIIVVKTQGTPDVLYSKAISIRMIMGLIEELPVSELGKKIAVHQSSKPALNGNTIYAVWAGAGDDMVTGEIGAGPMSNVSCVPGTLTYEVKLEFHPDHGKTWIHEGYLKFIGGGFGDYIDASIWTNGVPLQTSVSLDLIVTGDMISYAPGGAGTGTHGFADASKIILMPREFSGDGSWDYIDGALTPNMAGTGGFNMSTVAKRVHRFINRISCQGDCSTFFSMTSDETVELKTNTYLAIEVYNVSDTTWSVSTIIEMYREKTV